ncbi:MAG: DEAD/DEAH box helicase [Treponema sp.]|nr:DEAD/DEAH box helicase [Treponema sp.]
MTTFDSLGVEQQFINKLKERSIIKPTAIQSLVIPRLLEKKNIIFRSATGTGKTIAYLLPALQKIAPIKGKLLICAPTLELCSQIKAEADYFTEMESALLIGSVNIDRQIDMLKKSKPAIIVGNPGRLFVLAKMGKLKFKNLSFLIMDEADRLTSQECLEDTKGLLSFIEREVKNRQINSDDPQSLCLAACSATVSKKTGTQMGQLFSSVEVIESSDHEILRERIEHWALFSEKRRKVQTLRSLFAALKEKKSRIKALVFTSRNDEAGKILSQLQYHSYSAAGLFGKVNGKPLTGAQRKASLDLFREGKIDALVSTDLAARGLDIPGITHVIALDVPQDSEVYIHRCGRTGRAGKRGVMITIGDETQMHLLSSLEKKLKIRVMPKELHHGKVCAPVIEE